MKIVMNQTVSSSPKRANVKIKFIFLTDIRNDADKTIQHAKEQMLQIRRLYFDGLVQERRNSIANALELHLSRTNPSILYMYLHIT